MTDLRKAAEQALEALEEIALAGMSVAPEMLDDKEAFHARQAWRFIGIAARALEPVKKALAEQPEQGPVARLTCEELGYVPLSADGKNGPALRLRRANDNAEEDIGFDSNGLIDSKAIKRFLGDNT